MNKCKVLFQPQNKSVVVERGTSLLKAVLKAHITISNLCGGDGICGRCKMIVKEGEVSGGISEKLTREEIKRGYVLACMTHVESDLIIQIPKETLAKEKIKADKEASRFSDFRQTYSMKYTPSPLIVKSYLELNSPTLENNTADHERICEAICKRLNVFCPIQMGLKIMKLLPEILRKSNFRVTVTLGLRKDIGEIMNVEGGNTEDRNFMVIVDMGTTTIVAHMVNANTLETLDAKATFNSQGIYGREVTRRMISAEKKGYDELQKLLVEDINWSIRNLAETVNVNLKDITAVVCSGNTAMGHFILGFPTNNIRRYPYVATSVEPPPLRAAEVGIEINPRGLLYSLPGISAWVGSDITAGILATGIHEKSEISLLMDIGTNGEIVIGNKDWLVATSASAGPALEGASVSCGMRAESGAIERVYIENGDIRYSTIGNKPPKGICGSGIIDAVSVLLEAKYINRSGNFMKNRSSRIKKLKGVKSYLLSGGKHQKDENPVYITEPDIENVITAKAAIFSAMKILLKRLDMDFSDIEKFYIAGAFGNYINIENAISIGLLPNISREKFEFVGNTSIRGAKMVAFYREAFQEITEIRHATTYYDLMGANDYIEEFRKALFLPHTDIEQFSHTAVE
ncbi:MAG: hypothetical protein AMS17_04140 [Spirochaetes bacterium DG_61]|nr:MAG: hypothetical protein AMS17_04140 [Spirochaetes bacterium DG_61]